MTFFLSSYDSLSTSLDVKAPPHPLPVQGEISYDDSKKSHIIKHGFYLLYLLTLISGPTEHDIFYYFFLPPTQFIWLELEVTKSWTVYKAFH